MIDATPTTRARLHSKYLFAIAEILKTNWQQWVTNEGLNRSDLARRINTLRDSGEITTLTGARPITRSHICGVVEGLQGVDAETYRWPDPVSKATPASIARQKRRVTVRRIAKLEARCAEVDRDMAELARQVNDLYQQLGDRSDTTLVEKAENRQREYQTMVWHFLVMLNPSLE